jgi:hypothetical protein
VNKLEITPDKQYLAAAGNPHIRLYEVRPSHSLYDGLRTRSGAMWWTTQTHTWATLNRWDVM